MATHPVITKPTLTMFGPGVVKTQFKHLMEKQYELNSKKIIATIPMNKATDGEIGNFARDFFLKEGYLKPSLEWKEADGMGR